MANATFPYTRADLEGCLKRDNLLKAEDYLRAVENIQWHDEFRVRAQVKGTRARPYTTDIHFTHHRGRLVITGVCSCPVGFNCKHVAAVLLVGLQQPDERTPHAMRHELRAWLERFRAAVSAPNDATQATKSAPPKTHALTYVLSRRQYDATTELRIHKSRFAKDGSLRALDQSWNNIDNALSTSPAFLSNEDIPILRILRLSRGLSYGEIFSLRGEEGSDLLKRILNTGRAYFRAGAGALHHGVPIALRPAEPRRGEIAWVPNEQGQMRPVVETQPGADLLVLETRPFWYVDGTTGEVGSISLPCDEDHIEALLSIPPITLEEGLEVGATLQAIAPALPSPVGDLEAIPRVEDHPRAVLKLDCQPVAWASARVPVQDRKLDFGMVYFRYGGHEVAASSSGSLVKGATGNLVRIHRRADEEASALKLLKAAGFSPLVVSQVQGPIAFPRNAFVPQTATHWPAIMQEIIPMLRTAGWDIEIAPAFRFNITPVEAIEGRIEENANGWFDLEMGITVGERKIRLEPLLAELFRRDSRWLSGKLDAIPDDEAILLRGENHENLQIAASRIKPLVRVLIDLFDDVGRSDLRVSKWDVNRLAALNDTAHWQFKAHNEIQEMARRLASGPGVKQVMPPTGLSTTLRAYQSQGLSWMQFLREQSLGGVLADDMGLGKTVQALSHILLEKEAGRLDRPALVVMPTTLIHNWKDEAARFTPDLKVLDLHGPLRHERFDLIGEHDLVLSTYPLVWRDESALASHAYHIIILDEAQNVKNADTRAAQTLRNLEARHRLCLTGTPLENHLGELWGQF
ncbi:MAG: putative helicase, superfamily, partial [Pseudomonadota bacterium]